MRPLKFEAYDKKRKQTLTVQALQFDKDSAKLIACLAFDKKSAKVCTFAYLSKALRKKALKSKHKEDFIEIRDLAEIEVSLSAVKPHNEKKPITLQG